MKKKVTLTVFMDEEHLPLIEWKEGKTSGITVEENAISFIRKHDARDGYVYWRVVDEPEFEDHF